MRWPFGQTVTLTIIDQADQSHVVKVLHPDPAFSLSFERPKEDINIACGFAQFLPLTHLFMSDHAYVRDDCMTVRVVVDTRGIDI